MIEREAIRKSLDEIRMIWVEREAMVMYGSCVDTLSIDDIHYSLTESIET